jgi:hypothetical protein
VRLKSFEKGALVDRGCDGNLGVNFGVAGNVSTDCSEGRSSGCLVSSVDRIENQDVLSPWSCDSFEITELNRSQPPLGVPAPSLPGLRARPFAMAAQAPLPAGKRGDRSDGNIVGGNSGIMDRSLSEVRSSSCGCDCRSPTSSLPKRALISRREALF